MSAFNDYCIAITS